MTAVLSYIDDLYVKSLEHKEEGDKDKEAIERGLAPSLHLIT